MSQRVEVIVPETEQQGTTQVLANWLKTPGETVTINSPLVDLETDKVMVEVAAPASGILKEVYKQPGEEVFPGTVLASIETSEASTGPTGSATQSPDDPVSATADHDRGDDMLLSPAVRRLVKEHHLELGQITGSGKHGRVTKQDVLAFLEQHPESTTAADEAPPVAPSPAEAIASGGSTHIPHDAMRRRIARHMSESLLHTAPHVTSIFEADLGAIVRHRQQHRSEFERQGVKLTFTAYFAYAVVKAIESVPRVNSRFHEESLELFADINIGIGTALDDQGLIVPVLQRAQTRNLLGIAGELQRLTGLAREHKLTPTDLQGGTFTISNHGVSGSLVATPIIINQPQSAILGIGKMEKRVVVREIAGQDAIQIRPMAYVTLTIDHRALDGYQTNRFLSRLVEVIENWPLD